MPNEPVEQKEDTPLLSVEKLKSDNEALTKRVTALETQIKDMINELKSGSYTIVDGNDGSSKTNKNEKLQERLNKVFGNGKIN